MSNELSTVTATELTAIRVIKGVNRVQTLANSLYDGKKVERHHMGDGITMAQWTHGDLKGLLATFNGALGDIVGDNLLGACMNMKAALDIQGTPGNLHVDKPSRIMTALCLGGIVRQLDTKRDKSKTKKLTAKMEQFYDIAVDLVASYKAAQKAKEAVQLTGEALDAALHAEFAALSQ